MRHLLPVLALATASVLFSQTAPTADEIVTRIKTHVGIPWTTPTVDTFKAGDPATPITGIAVTMMCTMDVLERAAAAHANFVITHEPTFYSHLDETTAFEQAHDPVFAEKEAFIRDHHMVVWRFHDHLHQMHPDGILKGTADALGWQNYQNSANPHLFAIPETTVADLAEFSRTTMYKYFLSAKCRSGKP
jgi:NIF3 (NGG1p interacting factor 3)